MSSDATDQSVPVVSGARGRNPGNFTPRHAKLAGACGRERSGLFKGVVPNPNVCEIQKKQRRHTCYEALRNERRTPRVHLVQNQNQPVAAVCRTSAKSQPSEEMKREHVEGMHAADNNDLLLVADADKIHVLFTLLIGKQI